MPSERVQRQVDRLLDDAEAALAQKAWPAVAEAARAVLAIDEGNEDAAAYLKKAEANLGGASAAPPTATPARAGPETFANGRYEVVKFLGEGGRKKVYLAHDTLLDRQVAFALIKTEGLDEAARERITREAQTMGRLGNHHHHARATVLRLGATAERIRAFIEARFQFGGLPLAWAT